MNKHHKLYVHINKANGKRYFGITGQKKAEDRWNNGKGYKGLYFYDDIVAYGWNNFEHIVLFDNLTKEEAELLEQMYIALYNTTNPKFGYNIALGGKFNRRRTIEYEDTIGVYCIELNKYFNSLTEAGEYIGYTDYSISGVLELLHGITKTPIVGGYHWIYAEDIEQEIV